MTRHRKGLRPLSQTGLHRLPANPRQRSFEEGGAKIAGTKLAGFNETQDDRQLHPTKGFRKLSVKRGRAQMLMANIFSGRSIPAKQMGDFIAGRINFSAA